jgi:uncharacterized protein (UPF0332 family)
MAINPRDFLVLAKRIAGLGGEAAQRSAISRAYYAAFHAARLLFVNLGFTVPRGDRAHAFLSLRLQNSGERPAMDAGIELDDFRSNRNIADYDLNKIVDAKRSQDWLRRADALISAIENAAHEPLRTAITDAMKIYERDVLKDVTWHP